MSSTVPPGEAAVRFGVPRFGFRDKKPPQAEPATSANGRLPEPVSSATEPDWGRPIIEVNEQASVAQTEPDWGRPIIEVNDQAASVPPAPSARPPIGESEWGLEALAAETAAESARERANLQAEEPRRYPTLAELAEQVAAQSALTEAHAIADSVADVAATPELETPTGEAGSEIPGTELTWEPPADHIAADDSPFADPPVIEPLPAALEPDVPVQREPTDDEAYAPFEGEPRFEPVAEDPPAVYIPDHPFLPVHQSFAPDLPPVPLPEPAAEPVAALDPWDEPPATTFEAPVPEALPFDRTLFFPDELPAQPEVVMEEPAFDPLPPRELVAASINEPVMQEPEAPAVPSPPVAAPPPEEPTELLASIEPPAPPDTVSSLQGIALEEELKLVSDGLWAYKQYLEQFQGQLQRETDEALKALTSQLAAFEEQSAQLHRDFQVGMSAEERVHLLESGGPALEQTVRALEAVRAQQAPSLVFLASLGSVVQRYADLLEKVALFEGNLKRYMKQVDGTAKDRLRQSTRQDFLGSSAIIRSQEMERQRIAREIHDGPAQAIANVILRLDLVEKMMAQKPELVGKEFAKMKEIAQGALNEIRGFIFDLRPMTLQDLGLTATLKKIVQSNQTLSDCHFELIVEGTEAPLEPESELAIFRIAQEALSNVKKHAQANNAYVHLKYLPGEVVLIVEDDGNGFEAMKSSGGDYTHFGMIGMQERADDIDGDLQVISQKGRGTKVIFSLRTG